MAESSYTYTLTAEQGELLRHVLEERLFEFSDLPYGYFAAKRGKCVVNYYKSGKLVIQGKDSKEFIEFDFEPRVLGEARLGYEEELNPEMFEPHFGIDESGKGDFFGPLVIAGAYVDKSCARALMDLGVKDSKRITSDAKARDLAEEIRKVKGCVGDIVLIGPEKYNELYNRFQNLNNLLAWGHAKVIENLHAKVPTCPRALSDQFAHPRLIQNELKKKKITLQLQQRTKAESDIAVATASILARAAFLEKMERLSQDVGVKLGKGASAQVKEQAVEIARRNGIEKLATICKAHFKTFSEVDSLL
jgi:ribonuclease HIII